MVNCLARSRMTLIVLALVLGLAPLAGCSEEKKVTEVKMGVILPFSGSQAKMGQSSYEGAEVAREMVNEQGGVLGGKQVIFIKSDAPDPTAAVSEVNRLISQEKVPVVLGSYVGSIALATSEVTEKHKVIYWELGSIVTELTGRGYKYVFRTNSNADAYGTMAADYAGATLSKKLGIARDQIKVAIIHEDTSYGQAVGRAAERQAKELGLRVVAKEAYSAKLVDLSALILKLKDVRPDVVIATSYLNDAILFWKQARELGFEVKALIGTGGGHSLQDFVKSRGKDADGVLNVSNSFGIKVDSISGDAQKIVKEFQGRYQQKFGKTPDPQAYLAFTNTWVLLKHVLPQAGSLDPAKIRKAAMSLDLPKGSTPMGWGVKFGEDGQNTRAFPIIMQWQNGNLVTVAPENLATGSLTNIPLPGWAQR